MARPVKWSPEHWGEAKAVYAQAGGGGGALKLASEKTGIPIKLLKLRSSWESWAVAHQVEEKTGGMIADLTGAVKRWMQSMLGTVDRSIQCFEAIDAKGLPSTYPEAKIREETIAIHQDRVRKLFGLDQANGENVRQISADWKPAKIIEVGETEKPPSTNVESGLTGVEKG